MEPIGKDVVLSTYFTGKPDPQAGAKRRTDVLKHIKTWFRTLRGGAPREKPGLARPDEFDRMEVWYESLIRVGCEGVIFHDELSPDFVERWTHPQVRFQKYTLRTPGSLCDERYLCFLEWLKEHPHVERVFAVDLFDVEFKRNPFLLMDDATYDIYCGGDPGKRNDELNREKMIRAFGAPLYEDEIKLHSGTLGGPRDSIMRLLREMVDTFDELTARGETANLNMAVYNKCVYDLFDRDRIMWGNPLNSRFKRYEAHGNFAIRHK